MFNIRKYETYSWDAVNNISKEQVEEFIKLLQYQLNLDVVKPIIVEHKLDLPFEIADRSPEKIMTWYEAVEYVKTLGEGWRLPTIEELHEIYNSKNNFTKDYYWSSTEGSGDGAWGQNLSDGNQFNFFKGYSSYVRAVRDIIKQKPTLSFEIADKSTEKKLTWPEAFAYVESLGDGWRLPTKDELNQIYEANNDFIAGNYWSGTEGNGNLAWRQDMSNGSQFTFGKNSSYYVRAVRDI